MNLRNVTTILLIFLFSCSDEEINHTALKNYDLIDKYVQSITPTYSLILVMCNNVNINGTSNSWSYVFTGHAQPHKFYFLSSSFNGFKLDSISTKPPRLGIGPITKPQMDSNEALFLAQNNGGREFREANPNYTISAQLFGNFYPEQKMFWFITYRSSSNQTQQKTIVINALTKEIDNY